MLVEPPAGIVRGRLTLRYGGPVKYGVVAPVEMGWNVEFVTYTTSSVPETPPMLATSSHSSLLIGSWNTRKIGRYACVVTVGEVAVVVNLAVVVSV